MDIYMERILGKEFRSYWMGLSVIGVVFLHLVFERETMDPFFKLARMFFKDGDAGVNIFFLLSSYGLCFSYKSNSLVQFYWRRVARLYPMYLIYLLFVMCWRGEGAMYLLEHITGVDLCKRFGLAGDAWYISASILLYASFPVIFKVVKIVKGRYGIKGIYAIIVFLTMTYFLPNIHEYFRGYFHARFYVIVLGITTYLFMSEGKQKDVLKLYSFTGILSFLTFDDCSFYFYLPILLFALSQSGLSFPLFGLFSWFGRYSLEIYLAQAFIIQVLFVDMKGNYYVDAIVCLGLTAVAAMVLHFGQKYFWELMKKTKL